MNALAISKVTAAIENMAGTAGLAELTPDVLHTINGGYDYTQQPKDPIKAPPVLTPNEYPGHPSCPGYL
jgi:hypothetical protein